MVVGWLVSVSGGRCCVVHVHVLRGVVVDRLVRGGVHVGRWRSLYGWWSTAHVQMGDAHTYPCNGHRLWSRTIHHPNADRTQKEREERTRACRHALGGPAVSAVSAL